MHYYYHHIGDFRAASAFLPDNLQYAYLKLLWVYYDTEEPLPNNPAKLSLWAGVSQDQALLIMDEFFDLNDGAWHHARCDDEIVKYQAKSERARSANKKRWRSKTVLKSDPNQIPTKNQEPRTSSKDNSPNGEPGNSKSSPIPYLKIIDLFHTHCPKLPRVVKVTDKRKKAIGARWKDDADNLEYWEAYFKHAAKSKFLHGNNDRGWRADIDFLITERAMVGMQEGKYHHG